ncbi:glycosyltransferase family 29 protein [Streptomyces sp. NRRL F-5123]|uniref:glycosyltransferase family 29 protein n=1 Tax=Streptomyces sp. NRRL F-5123 TaxID=1463856 RepID=UPI0006945D6C|nr:glycosyltransferase family 29 protein [Streptomyces sp. NRRL F-5123]
MTKTTLGRRLLGLALPGRGAGGSGARTGAGAPTAADCLRLYEEEGAAGGALDAAVAALRDAQGGDLTDALLGLGSAALRAGRPALALTAADAVLARRKGSRAAWQLRGRALEAAGDLGGAVTAFEGYLEHTPAGSPGAADAAARLAALRSARRWRSDVLRALDGTDSADVTALADGPLDAFEAALTAHLDTRLAAAGPEETARLAPAVALYADRRRARLRPPLPDPLFGGTARLRIGEFRNLVAGRSVALVANSESLAETSLGAEIDAYDLVLRFTSFRLDPEATGRRTDIHVTDHRSPYNWDVPVTARLVLADKPADWRHALRERMVPGAQHFTGDDSLRRPLRGVGGLDAGTWPAGLTCGFEAVWLLDFLDVNPRLDLFGFDFFTTGPFRLAEAPATATPSDYTREREWILARAQHVRGPVISLR